MNETRHWIGGIAVIVPQPSRRLLPYKDPINGLFWAETNNHPYDNPIKAPQWAHATMQAKEFTAKQIKRVFGNDAFDECCTGPGCLGGPEGCNAKGCYGVRSAFMDMFGVDTWLWVHERIVEEQP